jgi:AcrR family transcriptional regulator
MSGMSGRQRLGAEQRREQLMAAAVEVLATSGYRAATADAIAGQAGVSKGLLWHYFADLEDLLELTGRQALRTLAATVGATLDLEAPAPEVIRAAIRGAARLTHSAERRAIREIVLNLRAADGGLRFGPQDYEELYTAQEAIFRRGQEAKDLRDDLDPRLLAVTYQGAVDGMLNHLDTHPEADPHDIAESVADVLLSGMSRHGPAPVRQADLPASEEQTETHVRRSSPA